MRITPTPACALALAFAFATACNPSATRRGARSAADTDQVETSAEATKQGAALVDRIQRVAEALSGEVAVHWLEGAFEVGLKPEGKELYGISRRWPMAVAYQPKSPDNGATLRFVFTDSTALTLADVERRFGPAVSKIEAKESLAAYPTTSGVRVIVGTQGGLGPASAVVRIVLDNRARP